MEQSQQETIPVSTGTDINNQSAQNNGIRKAKVKGDSVTIINDNSKYFALAQG